MRPGYAPAEDAVLPAFEEVFARAPGCQRRYVRALLLACVAGQLEIAAHGNSAGRRLNDQGIAVEDAVGYRDCVDAKRAALDDLARDHRAKIRAHSSLAQASLREAERQPAAEDRGRRCRDRVGKSPDVIFVAMGEHDAFDAVGVLSKILEVRDDHVDARQLGRGDHHAGIDQQQAAGVFKGEGVEAELAEAAEGYEAQRPLSHRRLSPHSRPSRASRTPQLKGSLLAASPLYRATSSVA